MIGKGDSSHESGDHMISIHRIFLLFHLFSFFFCMLFDFQY